MDLNKLKIDETKFDRKKNLVPMIVLCVVCLGLGFSGGYFFKSRPETKVRVKSMVIRASGETQAKAFTCGGWVEVAAPEYPKDVYCRVPERIETIHVHQGQVVKPGQVLAKLYDEDILMKLKVAAAKKAGAKQHLDKLKAGFREEDINESNAVVTNFEEKVRIAKANYDRVVKLKPGTMSGAQIDSFKTQYVQASAQLKAAKINATKLQNGYRKEEIEIAAAHYGEETAAYDLAKKDVDYCTVYAPKDGPSLRVLQLFRHVGEKINMEFKNSKLLSLYDPENLHVRVDVPQSNIKYAKPGGSVIVSTEAAPGKEYKGTVLRIEPLAELAKNTITVKIKIDDPDEMLFPDMIAKISFLSDAPKQTTKEKGVQLPTAAVIKKDKTHFVFTLRNGRAVSEPVKVTQKSDDGASVTVTGITTGQRVIVKNIEALQDGMAVEEEQ